MCIAVINLHTNICTRWLGKTENTRFLQLAVFQGAGKAQQRLDVEMAASDNPGLKNVFVDPLLICTAFKKQRFYIFSRREPDDSRRLVIVLFSFCVNLMNLIKKFIPNHALVVCWYSIAPTGIQIKCKNTLVPMHSDIVNGYQLLLCDAHTVPEQHRGTAELFLFCSLLSFSAFSFYMFVILVVLFLSWVPLYFVLTI